MRVRTLAVIAAAAFTVTACADTLDGRGARGPSPAPTQTSAGSTSVPTTSPSPTTSPTPSPGTTGARPLACAAGAVTASGAPFCYPLPPGFTDYSTLTNYGAGWTYKTLVSVDKQDLIEVFASPYPDTSSLSDADLVRRFDSVGRLRVGKYGIVRVSAAQPLRVAGARAFRQTGEYGNGVTTDYTTIFLGRTVANVQCQSLDHTVQVRYACGTVRATLQLVSL